MFHYCPRCAAPAPSFVGSKKILCGHCGFQLYHNTAAAVAVLLRREDSFIFLKRGRDPGKGLLDLPGGFVDPDESAEEACLREVREEIGVAAEDLRYLTSRPNTYPYKGITYKTCDLLFTGRCGPGDFLRQEEEIEEILLIPGEQIPFEKLAFLSIRNMLEQAFQAVDNPPRL